MAGRGSPLVRVRRSVMVVVMATRRVNASDRRDYRPLADQSKETSDAIVRLSVDVPGCDLLGRHRFDRVGPGISRAARRDGVCDPVLGHPPRRHVVCRFDRLGRADCLCRADLLHDGVLDGSRRPAQPTYAPTAYVRRGGLFGRRWVVEQPVLATYTTSYVPTAYYSASPAYRATSYALADRLVVPSAYFTPVECVCPPVVASAAPTSNAPSKRRRRRGFGLDPGLSHPAERAG